MPPADFDRLLSPHASAPPTPTDIATCMADIAAAWRELDRRMDQIHAFLPTPIRKAIDGDRYLDTFLAMRTMMVHAAAARGMADASSPNLVPCPYPPASRSEREAWERAYVEARGAIPIEEAA